LHSVFYVCDESKHNLVKFSVLMSLVKENYEFWL